MKSKKIASLFLALIMVFSTISSTLTVFASDPPPNDGLCPHHTQHTASCGYVAPTPEQPCTHVCSQESGCVQVNCIHVHDESCGYIEGVDGSCSHVCSEQTGCIVTQCIHTTHDASCGYAPATEGQACQNVCPICDCTCTDLCLANQTENPCPVCAADWTQCSFTTVDVSLRFSDQYAQYGPGQSVDLYLAASISGEKITQANVSIQLTEAEAALLTLPESDGNLALIDGPGAKFLVFAVTANQDTGSGAYTKTISVQSDGPATLDITKEDIRVSLQPEHYQNSQQVSVSINGDQLTFVKKLPTDGVYGSGTAFDTQVAEVPVNYINEDGEAIARQELAPTFTLYYQAEGDAPAALTEENLPFGLEQMPVITATPGEHTWTGSVEDASSLPSEVLTISAGSYEIKPVSWYLIPSYPDYSAAAEYTFVEITEENAAEYPAGLAKGWYYIAGPEPYPDDTITITSYLDSLQHNIYWADNGNVEKKRPETVDGLFELQFSLDGSSVYTTLDESNMASLGLNKMPTYTLNELSGIWSISWDKTLPSKILYSDNAGSGQSVTRNVSWRLVFKDSLDTYSMVEITEENAGDYSSVTDQYGTYYVLETSLTFTARIYRGDITQQDGVREAFYQQFYLSAAYSNNQHQYFQLQSVKDDGHIVTDGQDQQPNLITVTVTNLWRYNLDNTRINYSIQEGIVENGSLVPGSEDGKLDGIAALESGDYFAVSYDNSAVPSFSSISDAVYSGGLLKLTLTGTKDYRAEKVWMDDGKTQRPDALMELWRYRAGLDYTTASLVRNADGTPHTLDLSDAEQLDENTYAITFDGLPKYDAEGYRYVYVVREYLSGDTTGLYEQVFGSIDADGNIHDTLPDGVVRTKANTFVYHGGTLSNRLRGTIPVSVTKDWKAASFQSEFEDVMVELQLQSRHAGTEEPWTDTEYTYQMFDFLAENLTITHTGSYPQYDEQGQELEYRWVETAVYQGGTVIDGEYQGGTAVPSVTDGDSCSFTLEQNGRQIEYISTSTISDDCRHTQITNSIANVITYQVTKEFEPEWSEDLYADAYTFTLFRSTSGSTPVRYVTFTIDGNVDDANPPSLTQHVDDGAAITISRTDAWQVLISGLPEFDEDGQQYEYLLLEQDGNPLSMTTQRDEEGNYQSTVYNGPGENNIILVRKEWIDESDTQHRQPVQFTVYRKDTNEPLEYNGKPVSVTLGTDTTGWYSLVSIGATDYDDIYVLETQVGDTVIDNDTDGDGMVSAPVYTNQTGGTPTAVTYSTEYHKYELTYAYDPDFGASSEDGSAFKGGSLLHRHQPPAWQRQSDGGKALGGWRGSFQNSAAEFSGAGRTASGSTA